MKSQISPIVLCIIIAILFSFIPISLTAKSINSETTILNNPAVMLIVETTPSDSQAKENISSQGVEISFSEGGLGSNLNTTSISESQLKQGASNDSAAHIARDKNGDQHISDSSIFKKGVFYGFALMLILLNFICFFLFEEKIFLFFSFNLIGLSAFFISIDSLLSLIGISGIENIEAVQTTLFFIATIFGALFASKYLTLEEFYPKLKWITVSLLSFSFVMVLLSWNSATSFFSTVTNIVNLGVFALYFLASLKLSNKKNYAKFYVVALGFPLLFLLDMFVFKKLGFDFLSTESIYLKEATILGMLLMTLAIVYRMRAIKEEFDKKQSEMRIFLERQEVLNRTNAQELLKDMHLENLIMQYDLDGLEIKLLQYISEGKNNAKISRKLKITESEIELYIKELYNKLEIREQIKEDYRMVAMQPDFIYN